MPPDHHRNRLEKTADTEQRLQRFLLLYNANYHRMYLFARTLVPSEACVEDILQEVSLALWRKFDLFKPDTNFLAWAFRMIRIEVLEWQRKKSRERMFFDDEFLNHVAERMTQQPEEQSNRRYEALVECVKKLSPRMSELLRRRYFKHAEISEIAAQTQQSVEAVYQQLYRLRSMLRSCVSEKLDLLEQ